MRLTEAEEALIRAHRDRKAEDEVIRRLQRAGTHKCSRCEGGGDIGYRGLYRERDDYRACPSCAGTGVRADILAAAGVNR